MKTKKKGRKGPLAIKEKTDKHVYIKMKNFFHQKKSLYGKRYVQNIHPTKDPYSEYRTLQKDIHFNGKWAKYFKGTLLKMKSKWPRYERCSTLLAIREMNNKTT